MDTQHGIVPPAADRIRAELERIRASVVGVHGSLAATSDGLLVAHDVPDREPVQIAALVATTLAVASRATLATGRGQFREAVARGSDGYLAVYAAGESAIVAVIGTTGLNVGMLQYQARDIIERVALLSAEASAQARTAAGRARGPARAAAAAPAGPPGLPMRRRAT